VLQTGSRVDGSRPSSVTVDVLIAGKPSSESTASGWPNQGTLLLGGVQFVEHGADERSLANVLRDADPWVSAARAIAV
jgi:hypothetical protein